MQRIEVDDFSGGLSEQFATSGFTPRQWSKLKGFIIDSDYTIRSQWPAQSIGSEDDIEDGVIAVSGFTGSSSTWLVAVDTNGTVWATYAPDEDGDYDFTNQFTWVEFDMIDQNPDYRFITDVLLPIEGVGEVNALLLHSVSGNSNAYAIYEDEDGSITYKEWDRFYPVDQPNLIDPLPGEIKTTTDAASFTATTTWAAIPGFANINAPWTIANDGEYPFGVRIDTGETITTVQPKDSYTFEAPLSPGQEVQVESDGGDSVGRIGVILGDFPLARRNVMPRANAGTTWRNRLILADINTRVNPALPWEDTDNIQRAPYALFYSEAFPDSFREQAILFASSGESQILGLHVLDDFLITIASPETDTDGIRLFKGSLDYLALQAGTVRLDITVVRGGIGARRDLDASGNRNISCVWPEVGVVALLDLRGGVWFTDGTAVDRLDRTGPTMPDRTDTVDEIAALGKYLFVWRGGRLLLLNALAGVQGEEATGAWTEVSLPEDSTISSLAPVGGSMYFVMDNKVWRFAMGRNLSEDPERGAFDGEQVPLIVGTPTIGSSDQHTKAVWHRFGMRTRGRSNAYVDTISVKAGPTLDPESPQYSINLNRELAGRDELVVPAGIGSSVEASAEAVLRGDLQLESVTFWTTGFRMSRPADGNNG